MKKILLFCLTICFLTVKAQNVSITIDEPLPVCNPGDPTTLNANYIQTKTTTNNYTVTSIPYAPFYSTTGGTLLPAFTVDDNWSASISLPFKFCFFGQNYNSVIVGSNGVVHFQDGSQTPGGACAWSYSGTIPNAAFPIKNAIYGVYQDTDIRTPPVTAGNELVQCVNYYITGTAPNRVFVANFNQLPLFSCNSSMGMQTSQVILYETTNAIDVLVTRRTSCTSWNGGLGVIGIQNSAGTIAYTPAGRNSGTWSTTNEAWRFRPNAVNNTTLTWLANGVPIPSTTNVNPITVNPTACTNYTAQVDYLQCDGTNTTITATRTVCPEANLPVLNPQNITQCATVPPIPSFNINQNAYMLNGASASDYSFIYHIGTQSGTVIPTGSLGTYTPASLPQTIWVEITDQNTTGCTNFRSFVINAVASPSGTFSYSSPFCNSIITDQLPILNALTSGGAFSSVPPTGLALTASTGAIDPSTSTPGTYTVKYHINATGSCPAYDAPDVTVTILASPPAPTVTTPVTYCQNATASALTATGTGLLWYTVATGGTGSTTAPTPSTATAGSVTYYVSQTVSGCESLRAAIVVTVTAAPSAPAVSTPVNYCQNETASALTATGTGLLWYTVATGGTGSTTAPTPSTATVGSVTYYVSQTVSGCESPRAAIVVNVTALPAAPTVTSPVNYCQNATASALTATGTGLLWYTVATGGTGSATAPTPSTATVGSVTYYVSQTVSGCEGPRAAIVVNVTTLPAAPTVTSPVTYCQNATASALTATGTGLLWYTVATGGTGSATAQTPSTATAGSVTYYVSQTVSGCESPRAAIVVNVTATPAAPTVTSPVTYCQNATASALTATGTGLLWYTVATGGTGSTTAPTPSTATAGSVTYYVSQTVSGCESPRAAIVVNVTALPSAPTVTSPVNYCQNATASALTATGTGLLWYTVATGGTGSATAPTPSTATVGSVTYYVSQTVSGCEGPRAAIVVNVTTLPAAPTVTSPVTYCQNATASALTATGTGLLWYTAATGGTGSATAPTPSTATAGSVTYYVSQTVSGCESPRAAIVVNVTATPAAPTVTSPVTYCQNATASALTATGTGLLWYTVATGGTGSTTAPTPSTATAGSVTYYVSQTVSGCESPRAAIVVNVTALPSAPTVTSPVNYCQNATASALTATGTGLLWYTVATGGTGSATAPTPSTATVGSVTYYVSQTVSGCEGPRAAIVVNVTTLPAAPTVTSPVTYCQNATASALTATGTGLLWYTAATGGTGSATAPTPSTATAGSVTYYVSQTVSGCESPRAAIVVNVTATPAAPTVTSPVTYCQNATASALTATGTGLLWYTVATGGTGSTTAPTPSTATAGSVTYYVSQTVSGCESPRAAIVVNVTALPSAPTVTSPVNYCQNATASALTATGTGLLWYTVATGGTGSATAPTPSTATVGSVTYYVSQTVSGCEGPRAAIVVNVTTLPAAPTVTSPVTYCQNATASALTATGTGLLWYTAATGGTGSATAPTPSTATAGSVTYYVSQTVSGCESPRAAIVVNVTATPAAPTVTSPVTYCQNATASALTATGTGLLWYTVATGGTGSTTAPTPSTATAGSVTYYVSQTVSGCESPRAAIVVNVTALPSAPTVTSPVNYCQNATASALTATGTGLLWYTVATGGTGSTTAPTPSTATVGSVTYYVSQTVSGCEGPRAAIVVNVTATPLAPTVTSPVTYCQNATASALTATGAGLLWYTVATGGTGSATAPTPSTATAGSVTYYVSQTVSGCESPRAVIVVNVTATPAAPTVTSPVTYCQNATASAFTATGTGLLWYTVATGGTGSTTAPTPSTATAGSVTYYVSQTVSGCESPRAAIVVNVTALPSAPTVTSPVNYCQNATASALTATGTGLLWYTVATGGSGSSIAPIPSTATVGSVTYYVSQTVSGCVGPRAAIVVNVTATPLAPTVTSPVTYCQNATASALTATGAGLLWYTVATGGTGSATAPTPSTATAGSVTYYVSQTVSGCESPRAVIVVKVNPLPVVKLDDGYVCADTAGNILSNWMLDTGLGTSSYIFQWYSIVGGTSTIISTALNGSYLVTAPGVYKVRIENRITGCIFETEPVTISKVLIPESISVITSNYFDEVGSITVNVQPLGDYEYQLDNGDFQASNVFYNVLSGDHIVTVRNKCDSKSKKVTLFDYPKFFTPNGDGYNDTWNIPFLSSQLNSKIEIFDRMGKLLKVISPSGNGWDGTYLGQPLPATDYWFVVHYEEDNTAKVFKAHFAMKR